MIETISETTLEQKWQGIKQIHYRLLLEKEDIGEVWLCLSDEPDVCCIASVEIVEKHRGFGYGKQLMAHILKIAKEKGYKRAILRVRKKNEPAVGLYRQFGFAEFGSYEGRTGGEILYMELEL